MLNSTHDPSDYDANEIDEVVLSDLYLMMGQGMFKVDQVPAEICSPSEGWSVPFKVGDALVVVGVSTVRGDDVSGGGDRESGD